MMKNLNLENLNKIFSKLPKQLTEISLSSKNTKTKININQSYCTQKYKRLDKNTNLNLET